MAGVQIDGVNNKIDFDDDLDTSISANTDDTLVIEAGGNTMATITATTFTINDGTTITTADNTDTLSLISTDADATSGPNLRLFRNSSSPADSDDIGKITFSAENDASEEIDYITVRGDLNDVTDGTEDGVLKIAGLIGGAVKEFARFGDGVGVVFNEESNAANDFRIESDGNANMLFVNGGTDRVGIATASPATALDVNGTATVGALSDGTVTKSKIAFHQWKLTSNLSVSSGAADITAGMTQVEAVGSVLSVSSGVFTFPYTGKWFIQYQILGNSSAGAAYRGGAISLTTDNSSFSEIRNGFTSNATSTYFAVDIQYCVDITNVSTHKVKFRTENAAGGTLSSGTNFAFTYLGDT